MSKSIFLFKLNNNFSSLKLENNLEIFLDIFLKSTNNEFYKEQFNLMIDTLEINNIKNNLYKYFIKKTNFIVDENEFIINKFYKESNEKIIFYDKYIKIEYIDKSIFLEYLSLYYIDLLVIELEDEKIYQLHLVKSNMLV